MSKILTEQEMAQITAAVESAENRTSGEIVPVIVARSHWYPDTIWRSASMFAVIGLILWLLFVRFYTGWDMGWLYLGAGPVIWTILFGCIGALLAKLLPGYRRWLTDADDVVQQVHRRAMKAFVEEEVFNTQERTGILLMVSLFEHRIEVIGDEGINSKVRQEDWNEVVERIKAGIKAGALAKGLVDAIEMCGELLERKGVEIRKDDRDELPNRVRVLDV